ncbi:MAG TPA: bifunctional diaminohydroxyphosphoribosylaminopyrimidine deaminase/5-amino-6-(5-phosphoribosylamino)uracil reductase RibD [Segeticoccus sp.]|uniref:bifunctional diaminohydroxyphosphoribosylaminopyrimidine deaminase/5-amino-6-(5-phosphoribosylamino)uracil reductase RibD n=1 Tax=Segeticoccus sp. TaxID=2706531 RepID=UPI002D7E9727|nr:bifunctional diaminohydroxyphosphoribosylaminopyrimidine deaminase/5-amino-6-(5-phosphoribosylamino)uracil reductase RibD [Segeticoccus sp.]HET8600642.1 bifunctional diaminohydroxyphosphoribosylaminopyrimidine deaminase/5-amino-6-(5-phosphoribosylamino)uracil reductase RibD [Segeticoccus sp.]
MTRSSGQAAQDAALMRRAVQLAAKGPLGDPNPRVGAVLLDQDGHMVGEGHHGGAGTPHAEAAALDAAGERARGGTIYVTLEPCAHTGRTPPCARALVEAGVTRVVYGQGDPNPVAEGGAALLREAGIETNGGVLEEECRALNEAWTTAVRRGRPVVTWKFAGTLDGRVAAADGSSRWITGPAARADVHELRAACGAVVVGTGTALADDPWLTTRTADGRLRERQPLRVVVGRRGLPPGARVLDDAAPTLLLQDHDPAAVLAALAEHEVRHVWLEGGPTLAAAFLAAGLVDEVVGYLAAAVLGAGPGLVADLGIRTIGQALRLSLTDVTRLEDDIRIRARLHNVDASDPAEVSGAAEVDAPGVAATTLTTATTASTTTGAP